MIDPVILLCTSDVRTAALGAEYRYLREPLGVTVEYIPPFATPDLRLSRSRPNLRGKKVLVPIPVVHSMREGPVIAQLLQNLQHNVDCIVRRVTVYCTLLTESRKSST